MLAGTGELQELRQQLRGAKRELAEAKRELAVRDDREAISDQIARAADAVLRDQSRRLEHHKNVFNAAAAVVRAVIRNVQQQFVHLCLFAWKNCYVRLLQVEKKGQLSADRWREVGQVDNKSKSGPNESPIAEAESSGPNKSSKAKAAKKKNKTHYPSRAATRQKFFWSRFVTRGRTPHDESKSAFDPNESIEDNAEEMDAQQRWWLGQSRRIVGAWSRYCFKQAQQFDHSMSLLFVWHVWSGCLASTTHLPNEDTVQQLKAVLLFWLHPLWKGPFGTAWLVRFQTFARSSSFWWIAFALWHVWLAKHMKLKIAGRLANVFLRQASKNEDERKRLTWQSFKSSLHIIKLEDNVLQNNEILEKRRVQVDALSGSVARKDLRTFVCASFFAWATHSAKSNAARKENVAEICMTRLATFFFFKRTMVSLWSAWLKFVRLTFVSKYYIANYFSVRAINRATIMHYLKAWVLLCRINIDLRRLSRSHLFVLKRQQSTHNRRMLRCLFSLWGLQCVVDALERSGLKPAPSNELHPRHLRDCVEALVSIRSRRWRLYCDLRSGAESILLKVGEVREAMLLLIQQGALRAMHEEHGTFDRDLVGPSSLVPAQQLIQIIDEARASEHELEGFQKLRSALGSDLLKTTAIALRIILESRRGATADVKAEELLGRELGELGMGERQLARTCDELAERVSAAVVDIRSVSVLHLELDMAVCLSDSNERVSHDSQKLIEANDVALRTLDKALESLVFFRTDAESLLKFLENSQLLGGLYHVPVVDSELRTESPRPNAVSSMASGEYSNPTILF